MLDEDRTGSGTWLSMSHGIHSPLVPLGSHNLSEPHNWIFQGSGKWREPAAQVPGISLSRDEPVIVPHKSNVEKLCNLAFVWKAVGSPSYESPERKFKNCER